MNAVRNFGSRKCCAVSSFACTSNGCALGPNVPSVRNVIGCPSKIGMLTTSKRATMPNVPGFTSAANGNIISRSSGAVVNRTVPRRANNFAVGNG